MFALGADLQMELAVMASATARTAVMLEEFLKLIKEVRISREKKCKTGSEKVEGAGEGGAGAPPNLDTTRPKRDVRSE